MADESSKSVISETPDENGPDVPPGHLLVNEEWVTHKVVTLLRDKVFVVERNDLDIVDFYPSSKSAVLYFPETRLSWTTLEDCKSIIKEMEKVSAYGYFLYECTWETKPRIDELLSFMETDMCKPLNVTSSRDAAQKLIELVNTENPGPSPFPVCRPSRSVAGPQETIVRILPKLGKEKAKKLVDKFSDLSGIANASLAELASMIPEAEAHSIFDFFNADYQSSC